MKRAPRSRQRHDLYAKYHDYDSEISDLLGECGSRYLASPAREKDKTGLDRFAFKADSGYGEQELFTGEDADGRLMLLICQRSSALVESPNCMRTLLLTQNLALSYRYKRAHLAQWRHIDAKMIGLIKSFEAPGLPSDFEGTIDD